MSTYWLNSIKEQPKFNKIDNNYECDICIIGGGLTGLTCGYYLSQIGFNVIIVENSTATDFKKNGNHYITYVNNYEIKSSNICV